MTADQKDSEGGEVKEPDDSERDRFGRFVKKLVNVPKREIDEKAKEWEHRRDRRDG